MYENFLDTGYSNDLREVVIKHVLIVDSEREIACKVLILRSSVNYMITKYKSMKCIGNMIGRGRKRKTTIHTHRIIQRKIKTDRRKSSTSVKVELQTELNITISETTIRRRAHEIGLCGRVARKNHILTKQIEENGLNMLEHIVKSLWAFGIMQFGRMKANSTYLG